MTQAATQEKPTTPGRMKKQIGVKLSPDALRLRRELGAKLGIDGTAVIELAIRALAEQKGVE